MHPVWHSLLALHHRIDALLRHCERLETRLDTTMRLTLLQQQVAELKAELEALKAAPRQIVIEKLENRVDTLTVNTLNGILNVGIAHNAALPVDPQLLVSNRPLADLVNPEEGTAPSPHAPIDTPPDGVPPAAPSPNGGKPDAQHETEPDAEKSAPTIAVGTIAVNQILETGSLNIGHTRIVRLLPIATRKMPSSPRPQAHPNADRREQP
ncbi:MAG: spore germination protein GerPC [Calditerricola sp.]|nr:spore germination protein GerPC [Calditerricola sp.]